MCGGGGGSPRFDQRCAIASPLVTLSVGVLAFDKHHTSANEAVFYTTCLYVILPALCLRPPPLLTGMRVTWKDLLLRLCVRHKHGHAPPAQHLARTVPAPASTRTRRPDTRMRGPVAPPPLTGPAECLHPFLGHPVGAAALRVLRLRLRGPLVRPLVRRQAPLPRPVRNRVRG